MSIGLSLNLTFPFYIKLTVGNDTDHRTGFLTLAAFPQQVSYRVQILLYSHKR